MVKVCATPFRFVGRKRHEWILRKEKLVEIEELRARYHPDNISKEDLLSMFTTRDEAYDCALNYNAEMEVMMPYYG